VRIALLTEGGYPYARGESGAWCDRLVRDLTHHHFDVYALSRSPRTEAAGLVATPPQVHRLRQARLWGEPPAAEPPRGGRPAARAARTAFGTCFRDLASALAGAPALCPAGQPEQRPAPMAPAQRADRFAAGLYGLADLAQDHPGALPGLLRGDDALGALEAACRAPGVRPVLGDIVVTELLMVADELERQLRPLSANWYGPADLGAVDVCHAVSGGPAALPGLLAKRFCGTPLIVTEYTVRAREALLAHRAAGLPPAVRALLGALHRLLAGEAYRQAALVTPGSAHVRRWQERCGAPPERLRTIHPGIDEGRFARAGAAAEAAADETAKAGAEQPAHADPTVAWVGRADPAKDLIALLHAFHAIRREEPRARLRVFHLPAADDRTAGYLGHCRTLASQLFPDEAEGPHEVGENPVSFEEIGSPGAPEPADAYAAGDVVVLSSSAEGFPLSLVEAMFCGRPTVSTDVGAVREVIGGTGLVVPPRNPRALAEATLALLRGPERAARLGAAARERALALFTVTACVDAFRESYLEVMAHHPVRRPPLLGADGSPRPFTTPPESLSPSRLAPTPAHPAWTPTPGPAHS
jgi:glycosyltransferase involved in cell wall biosynthesis